MNYINHDGTLYYIYNTIQNTKKRLFLKINFIVQHVRCRPFEFRIIVKFPQSALQKWRSSQQGWDECEYMTSSITFRSVAQFFTRRTLQLIVECAKPWIPLNRNTYLFHIDHRRQEMNRTIRLIIEHASHICLQRTIDGLLRGYGAQYFVVRRQLIHQLRVSDSASCPRD